MRSTKRGFAQASVDFVVGWRQPLEASNGLHSHPGFELVRHPSGQGRTTTATGAVIDFAPGSIVWYAPGVAHDQTAVGPGEEWCIQAVPRHPFTGLPDALHLAACDDPFVSNEFALLTQISPDERVERQDELNLRVAALLMRIHTLGQRPERREISQIRQHAEQARTWLREHFRDQSCLEKVVEEVAIGADHLRHCFKREFGTGMASYVASLRLAYAKDLLAHSRLPLTAIAQLCGYATARYLCRVFKEHEGAPPGHFRGTMPRNVP
jgi:AraC-like DNA-binding protein